MTTVRINQTGELLTVWSDNIDEQTYSCLPIEIEKTRNMYDESCMWIGDLVEFPYKDVTVLSNRE